MIVMSILQLYNQPSLFSSIHIIILTLMKENQIKLNQIVTEKEMKQKRRGSLHALNNSFKRNTLLNGESTSKNESCYQCKLPEVNFSRRDLSIILRYLLYKQEMQPSDRNLLRRILLSIFDEELISAGTKKFVNYLKLNEGVGSCDVLQEESSQFYFVLKGKGEIQSGEFTYYIKQGDTFGQIEILSEERISKIQFESKFLLLQLDKQYFNEYFRVFYQKIYSQKENQLQCIKQNFLDKIPLLNKYLFLNKLEYKTFTSGQKIVIEGQALKNLYFLSNNTCVDVIPSKCIGLSDLLKQKKVVRQTIYCNEKITLPYIDIETFSSYVLINASSFIMNESSIMDRFKINTRTSYEAPQRIANFMKIKKVKLKLNRSRLKTDVNEFYETSFKFFKPKSSGYPSVNPQKSLKQTRPSTKLRYERPKNTTYAKPFRNNYF